MIKLPQCQSKSNVIQVEPRKLMIKLPHCQSKFNANQEKPQQLMTKLSHCQSKWIIRRLVYLCKRKTSLVRFIVRRGWYIKGQDCDFCHANLPGSSQTSKDEKSFSRLYWFAKIQVSLHGKNHSLAPLYTSHDER